MSFRLALDFDATLADRAPDGHLAWRPGALEAIRAFRAADCTLILHSRRSSPDDRPVDPVADRDRFVATGELPADVVDQWNLFDEMRRFMKAWRVWDLFEVWQAPGKPRADRFIDDKAESPDWAELAREFGVVRPGAMAVQSEHGGRSGMGAA